ncbi:endolytic transglycosylase MltG [Legionella septentrionalis]|uniref:Endolytic murein transglycosylase n=2 Tax=Legionella septentrionalis TaxID=2498109 RepID=A0A3S0V4P0_9GAMM|nr:endolytic transglycosylase MltG [Legionella sp. 27cVA30]RUQ81878.1 endolytic transglycosylase MltG [Legionella septentrionalis]RUR00248.1 endolytic transglycosylase MltG [Legionella septentrionalis]
MQRFWIRFILIACAIVMFFGSAIVGFNVYQLLYRPMGSHEIVRLDKNTSAYSFARILKERGLIKSKRLFLILIRMQDLSQQLKAGIYEIQPEESAQQFLRRVALGDVLQETFAIIEGTTQAQIAINLKRAAYLNYDPVDWLAITGKYPNAEGLLLADTYHYDAGSTSKQLLAHAHQQLQDYLAASWEKRSPNLPYKSPYELLITASILEKETSLAHEKRLIAGVIINRLRKNMPLQMDPTVIYGLGDEYKGKLTHKDMSFDSPYNTYLYRGLPPTPIAMVGKDAIDAAAHPEHTNYLYFVAKGDGSHHFSVTYEQQKAAINKYSRR